MTMDRREQDHRWYETFDERSMSVTVLDGEVTLPVTYEVCETCNGRGKHVNPAIDGHGLSAEDFNDDPDFAEDYCRGFYDVPCAECDGQRVALALDTSRATAEEVARHDEICADRRDYAAMCDAERRAGA